MTDDEEQAHCDEASRKMYGGYELSGLIMRERADARAPLEAKLARVEAAARALVSAQLDNDKDEGDYREAFDALVAALRGEP